METTIRGEALDPPVIAAGVPIRLSAAAPSLWRVIDATGRVIGHLQALSFGDGIRYRARRFQSATRAFLDLGDFWNADDAIECLRFVR
ncbi:hypothetical protein [Microbacterium allomyrinae]|jgi:hypothetical protein|uniref:DNA mismatch repair protein n=1 Tax=Microbacterium allomyrinae TaxID=2830666 RepID=A0A9X1LUC8_9MICO|nr:hypothetical protein [Microbacterium allomyrinae]MCC2032317.1 hypothetical protein [Microbacterium allomyrinae]